MGLLIASCQTPKEYFERPSFSTCINNGDGTMECGGDNRPSINAICSEPDDFNEIYNYYDDKEYRLFICLKYPSKCR